MSMDRIKVIVKEPGEPVGHMTEIENTLEAMQKIVGGYIETVPVADGSDRIILIVNEEGKYMLLEENFWAQIRGHWDLIVGPVIVCGDSGEDFVDVPIDLDAWQRLLKRWED